MDYSELADIYEKLESTSSKLKKTEILAEFFSKTPTNLLEEVVLMVQGIVYPGYSEMELGIADKMMIRAIVKASGFKDEHVVEKFKKTGDLGLTAEECIKSRRQFTLSRKKLTVDYVFKQMRKLAEITGEGSQEKKLNLIVELLVSSKPKDARYIARTILATLRVGAAEGIIRDAIVDAFLKKEKKEEAKEAVEYAKNILTDLGEVAKIAKEKGISGLKKVKIELGKPIQVMLAEKEESIEKVLKKYKKVAIEWKFDGVRAQIHKKGDKVWIYTRRLEDVTKQFPDVVDSMKKSLKPKECVVEGEVLGISKKGDTPLPFQMLSQRIHRKYEIEKMTKEIPVKVMLFDVIYVDGDMYIEKPYIERRKILEKVAKEIPGKVELAKAIVTESLKEAEKFYESALKARQEGIMIKILESRYVFGRHVDGWIKIKPIMETLDLVVIGATWGEGARSKWMTSYVLGCKDPDTGKFLECGMMSTGLTEEEYQMMTDMLKPLITKERGKTVEVKPKIVLEVAYQNIQKSPNYESGFALRFPALKQIREDKGPSDADTIQRVKKLYESQGRAG